MMVARNDGNGHFGVTESWSSINSSGFLDFSDADGWGTDVNYYGTIRLVDVNNDGKADVVCRSSGNVGTGGIYVSLSTGSGFGPKIPWKTDDFTDDLGWHEEKYSTTIQFADVNGDSKPDLVARGYNGIVVALNTGSSFGDTQVWSSFNSSGYNDFSDDDGWGNSVCYYGTIRCADINGDGIADICGRSQNGIVVAFGSKGLEKFLTKTIWTKNDFRDSDNWNYPKYSSTIQFGDINGFHRASLVARFSNGLVGGFVP